jgi:4-alpha-glucanotransferase
MPGTVDAWPNWSLALPTPLEQMLSDPRVLAVVEAMRPRALVSGDAPDVS